MADLNQQTSRISLEELILKLYSINCFKFGKFTLKSGQESPIYIDLRVVISYPDLMVRVSEYMWNAAKKSSQEFVSVCGVPYTALPLATCISTSQNLPMLLRRKEAKAYGTKKVIEGTYNRGDVCLVIEDVVTTGSSVLETVEALNAEGLVVKDAVVLLDRDQGAKNLLQMRGINLHRVFNVSQILDVLESADKVGPDLATTIRKYISDSRFASMTIAANPANPVVVNPVPLSVMSVDRGSPSPKRKLDDFTNGSMEQDKSTKQVLQYRERACMCSHPVTKQLFAIMDRKRTNLALSLDVTNCKRALELLDLIGPHICLVKTHVDILEDFSSDFIENLTRLAKKHTFLIFEDRKFADIGNTVSLQYGGGWYKIAEWAHIINAHALPGEGVLQGLKHIGLKKDRGCLLVAEMSSQGNLANGSYTQACVKMADDHDDFVIGFICQRKLSDNPEFIHMTPGVRLDAGQDWLGQSYTTPETVICENRSDVIIVGRGIIEANDPLEEAKRYQQAGYNAYEELFNCQMG